MPSRTSVRLVAGMAIVVQVIPTSARARSRLHLSSTVTALSLTGDSDHQTSNDLCGSASVDRERTNVIAVARSSTLSRDVVREARANPPVKWQPRQMAGIASIGLDPITRRALRFRLAATTINPRPDQVPSGHKYFSPFHCQPSVATLRVAPTSSSMRQRWQGRRCRRPSSPGCVAETP